MKNNEVTISRIFSIIKKGGIYMENNINQVDNRRGNRGGNNSKNSPQFLKSREPRHHWGEGGIYKLQFGNKVYIGSTKNFGYRYWINLNIDKKYLDDLWEAIEEEENYILEVLEIVEEDLLTREQYWINYYSLEGYEVINEKSAKNNNK